MKKHFTISFILIASISWGQAQKLKNKHTVAVENTNFNVLIIGVKNPITIAVSGIPSEKIKVKINKGEITGSMGQYIVKETEAGIATLEVFIIDINGKESLVEKRDFKIKSIPDPLLLVNGITVSGNLTLQELLNIDILTITQPWDNLSEFTLSSFKVSMLNNGNIIEITAGGSKITDQMRTCFKQLKRGDIVYFEGGLVTGPDGLQRTAGPVKIKIL